MNPDCCFERDKNWFRYRAAAIIVEDESVLMKSRGTKELNSESYSFYGVREEMYWLPIKELDQYKAYPAFMKEYLQSPSDGVVHIVTRE